MTKLARTPMATAYVEKLRIIYGTFFYNSFTSPWYILETLAEPLFWVLDRTVRPAGPVFVLFVCSLTMFVIVGFYTVILPVFLEAYSLFTVGLYLVLAHWLLVNIVFHYWMAVTTNPGAPPPAVDAVVSICKLCVSPKPPRTHHCGICSRCVLKMDHHCPWLNNCVGHNNHRYFFLFMVYMQLGSTFVCFSSFGKFYNTLFSQGTSANEASTFQSSGFELPVPISNGNVLETSTIRWWNREFSTSAGVISVVLFFLCMGTSFSLSILLTYHSYLITRGETSIEKHINAKERRRLEKLGQPFRNLYNAGWRENWRQLLGLYQGRNLWRHVLIPSRHPPQGDGITWIVKYE